MSFQSYWFAIFLALTVCLFYAVPKKLRLAVLLAANAVFFLWADVRAGVWLLLSVVSTWAAGLWLGRQYRAPEKMQKPRTHGAADVLVLAATLALNLGLLALFQYIPVWERELEAAFGLRIPVLRLAAESGAGLAAPLGISFYTLQAIGYLLDIWRGRGAAERSLPRYAAFVSFFPNLMSGPIERGGHFLEQLDRVLAAKRRALLVYDRMAQGMISILLGFFMKLVIADRAALLVDYLYGIYQDGNSFTMTMAALFYAVQIYCDFASYSCIAVGAAQLFGFELIRNFRQPYFACGISDFWRRWHISLSSWLRDYVYIPLGGNRKGALRKEVNLVVVFLVSGLWHGGAPTFLLWGLLYGLLAAGEDLLGRAAGTTVCLRGGALFRLRRLLGVPLTFCLVSLLWIIFRSESLEMAAVCLRNLFTRPQGFLMAGDFLYAMGLPRLEFWIAVGAAALLFFLDFVSERRGRETAVWIYESPLPVRWGLCLLLLALVAVFGRYGHGVDPTGFIYVDF